MPYDLTPVDGGKRPRLPLDEIDADIQEAVESAFEYCKTADNRLQAVFETKEEAEDFLHAARSYCYQHEPRLVLTGNTLKNGAARFRITESQ